jgi:hypothetical protein
MVQKPRFLKHVTRRRALTWLLVLLVVKSSLDIFLLGAFATVFYYKTFNPSLKGYLDEAGPQWIRGWALNEADTTANVEVQLYIDGRFIDSKPATFAHPSIKAMGKAPDENHGFFFYTPPLEPGEHEARAYACWTSGRGTIRTLQMLGNPIKFQTDAAPAEPYFRGWLDSADTYAVKGWAIDRRDPSNIVRLRLYLNGRMADEQDAKEDRPDLAEIGFAPTGRHGFRFVTPVLEPGEYEARVYAVLDEAQEDQQKFRLIGRPIKFSVPK